MVGVVFGSIQTHIRAYLYPESRFSVIERNRYKYNLRAEEVEPHNAQIRMNLTDEQRRYTLLSQTPVESILQENDVQDSEDNGNARYISTDQPEQPDEPITDEMIAKI